MTMDEGNIEAGMSVAFFRFERCKIERKIKAQIGDKKDGTLQDTV